MNLPNRKIIVGTILVIVIAIVWYLKPFSSDTSGVTNIGTVVREDLLQRVTIAGSVIPLRKTIITAPYAGYVKKIFVKVGDKVKIGDPLVSVVQSLVSDDGVFPLRSPLNGTVMQIESAEGEYVKEGDTTAFIMRIDDTEKLFIMADAPEIDRVKVKADQSAVIKASAILSRTYKGIIKELSLAARTKERWSRSQVVEFPIRIEVIDPDEQLHPGMSVVLDVITEKKEKVLTLRHEFIRKEGEDQYFVITAAGKKKDIQVGLQNEESFEIISGLKEGEKIRQVDFAALGTKE